MRWSTGEPRRTEGLARWVDDDPGASIHPAGQAVEKYR
jgi:hypothetical protein